MPSRHWGSISICFSEPAKSIIICAPNHQATAKAALRRFDFQYRDGFWYVSGFIESDEARKAWLEPQIQQWVAGIHKFACIARHFPQMACAGMLKSLQLE
jgi:hypothetical protein